VAWNAVDHLVKLEGVQLKGHGDVELDVDGGEGADHGTTSLLRAPLVAEERSDSVPMGRGLRGEITRLDRDLNS
jgi:hypothetical protein